jgi:hypothetical protein
MSRWKGENRTPEPLDEVVVSAPFPEEVQHGPGRADSGGRRDNACGPLENHSDATLIELERVDKPRMTRPRAAFVITRKPPRKPCDRDAS